MGTERWQRLSGPLECSPGTSPCLICWLEEHPCRNSEVQLPSRLAHNAMSCRGHESTLFSIHLASVTGDIIPLDYACYESSGNFQEERKLLLGYDSLSVTTTQSSKIDFRGRNASV